MPLSLSIAHQVLPAALAEVELPEDEAIRIRYAELVESDGSDAWLTRVLTAQSFVTAIITRYLKELVAQLGLPAWTDAKEQRYRLTIGFIEIDPDKSENPIIDKARHGTDRVFGAAILDLGVLDEEFQSRSHQLRVIDLGEFHSFLGGVPFLRIPVAEELHYAPHMAHGSTACWAKRGGESRYRILTAAHNFQWSRKKIRVPFRSGAYGTLSECTPHPVDAALVDPAFQPQCDMKQIVIEPVPVETEPFVLFGLSSGRLEGLVDKTYILPGVSDPFRPQTVDLDTPGRLGDSGALVLSRKTGRALGIYSGVQRSANDPRISYVHAQAMQQACNLLGISIWERP